jgi:hypothetical protein
MRARNLKPSFFKNEDLADIEPLGRLLFQGLWCLADREGRLEDRPKRIRAEVLPYDHCDVDKLLDALAAKGFILRYTKNNNKFIQIANFKKHQFPHTKERESTIPAPDLHQESTEQEPIWSGSSFSESLELNPESLDTPPTPREGENPRAVGENPRAKGRPTPGLRITAMTRTSKPGGRNTRSAGSPASPRSTKSGRP